MTQADIDASRAPLMEHLIELRSRLLKSVIAFVILFFVCFFFAKQIYNILVPMPTPPARWASRCQG
jgi:sec-independent protein translocase protein TatC